MKKFKVLAAIMVIFLLLSVLCYAEESELKITEKVRIALIIPSTIDDMAWSQVMYEGIKAVQQKYGEEKIKLEVSERLWNAVDAGSAIRQYASQGFDIVIAHGAQYQSVLDEVAPDFPKTSFAYGTGFATNYPNIFAYDPQAQQGAYLLGIMAGLKTKTNIVGIVGPVKSGDAIKYNIGFEKGVKSVNPEAAVRIAYTGSFGDLVAAGEIARTHIKAGADVLSGTAQQCVGAIRVASEFEGVIWLSSDMDQSSIAPQTVLASQSYRFDEVIEKIISFRQEGIVGGKHLELTLANGYLEIIHNPKLVSVLTPKMNEVINEAKAKIISGEIKVELK
ncbi:MAG: BMP family protein [Candidatus Tenebribacter mawsonii]|nr:BMP family protein [Candidatus Tenebribacter mawsonii]